MYTYIHDIANATVSVVMQILPTHQPNRFLASSYRPSAKSKIAIFDKAVAFETSSSSTLSLFFKIFNAFAYSDFAKSNRPSRKSLLFVTSIGRMAKMKIQAIWMGVMG